MTIFQQIKNEVVEHRIQFIVTHLLFWAAFIIGIAVAVIHPQEFQDAVYKIHHSDFTKWVGGIYKGNNISLAKKFINGYDIANN